MQKKRNQSGSLKKLDWARAFIRRVNPSLSTVVKSPENEVDGITLFATKESSFYIYYIDLVKSR